MRRVAVLLAAAAGLFGDAYPRQPGIDVKHYVFGLELSDTTNEIRGESRVQFVAASGVAELTLDLAQTMTVDGVTGEGQALAYVHRADRLQIALRGRLTEVTVRYHGAPAAGLRIGANLHGDRTFFGLNWPDLGRQWLPMIDHPYDKATSEFLVTAPSAYQVVANGLLVEEADLGDGRRMTHWKQGVPIASWLHTVAVARFSVRHWGMWQGVALSNWVFPQDRAKGTVMFDDPTRRALAYFTDMVGPYPYEKLAQVQAAGLSGGTEHASVILYGEKSLTGRPAGTLVPHEIAHQWFGDSITESDWNDVWLSEGFATYLANLYVDHVEGRDAFVTAMKRSRTMIETLEANHPDTPVIHRDLRDMKLVLNRLVYQKGAWVLHMLRAMMGDAAFRAGLREYYRQYRDGHATTADFQRVMEAHAGVELGWFFDQWLRRPGIPEITGNWSYGDGKVRVRVRQTQEAAPFRVTVEIGLGGGRVERVEMREREGEYAFAVEREPEEVKLDPNTVLLGKIVQQRAK